MKVLRCTWLGKMVLLAALTGALSIGSPALAQSPDGSGGDFPVRDSTVGYIDNAIPGNVLRIRGDAAYQDHHPVRGEFFYARGQGHGPGLPLVETNVDYQEAMGYMEFLVGEHCSMFCEVPVRFLNPEINENHAGLGDVNGGIKYAVLEGEEGTLSVQFRTYAPSGDAHLGLGNRHVSVEPAILFFMPVDEMFALEGECRYWLPIGDAGFGGDLIRYGLAVECKVYDDDFWRVTPVVETVGWTFLHGRDTVVLPSGEFSGVIDAAGQTIVNVKAGLRVGIGEHFDIYGGVGHPLTGDKFYENIYRVELRLLF